MPIELRFANPQSAKVAIVKERGSRVACIGPQPLERDKLIRHHAQAQQIADRVAILPGNADHPRDRRKRDSRKSLQGSRGTGIPCGAQPVAYRAKAAIHQIDQRDEGNQHGGNVEREVQAIDRPARNGGEGIHVALPSSGICTCPAVSGVSVSGTSIFAIRIVPGAVMITAASKCSALIP